MTAFLVFNEVISHGHVAGPGEFAGKRRLLDQLTEILLDRRILGKKVLVTPQGSSFLQFPGQRWVFHPGDGFRRIQAGRP